MQQDPSRTTRRWIARWRSPRKPRRPPEIPVGAVVLDAEGRILAEGRNNREETTDPTGHAEIVALRAAAAARGSWNLEGCTLVVTMEPCVMCAGAILQSRIGRVVFGAWDDKAGAAGSRYDLLRDRRLPYRAEVVGGDPRGRGGRAAAGVLRGPALTRGASGARGAPPQSPRRGRASKRASRSTRNRYDCASGSK